MTVFVWKPWTGFTFRMTFSACGNKSCHRPNISTQHGVQRKEKTFYFPSPFGDIFMFALDWFVSSKVWIQHSILRIYFNSFFSVYAFNAVLTRKRWCAYHMSIVWSLTVIKCRYIDLTCRWSAWSKEVVCLWTCVSFSNQDTKTSMGVCVRIAYLHCNFFWKKSLIT